MKKNLGRRDRFGELNFCPVATQESPGAGGCVLLTYFVQWSYVAVETAGWRRHPVAGPGTLPACMAGRREPEAGRIKAAGQAGKAGKGREGRRCPMAPPREMTELWGMLSRPNLNLRRKQWSDSERAAFHRALRAEDSRLTVWVDPDRLMAYTYDATGERHRPDAAILLQDASQIGPVLAVARRFGCPVIGRGAGTSLSGGTTPVLGGIVLAFAQMRRVLAINEVSRQAVVEPGLVNADFQAILAEKGLFFAPDPSSHRISTVGGNTNENSGGPHCIKYGVTTNHVLGGHCYLIDGRGRTLPTTRDWRAGLDLTGIIVGSEGTLAIVDQIEVVLTRRPPAVETLLAAFDTVESAIATVSAIIARQIVPSTLELLDRKSIQTVERFVHAGYPADAGAVLLIEIDGPEADVSAERATIEAILGEQGALSVQRAQTPEEVEALWKGRRSAYGAAAQIAGHLWIQDVTVPRPLLPEMMKTVSAIGERYGFDIMTIAHAGDGNLHPQLPYNPSDPEEVSRMREADEAILRACVALGGSITGEHGIGIDKLEQLALMYGPQERDRMAEIRQAFDPEGLLNPGKAVLPLGYRRPEETDLPPAVEPADPRLEAMREMLQGAKATVAVRGSNSQAGRSPSRAGQEELCTRSLDRLVDVDVPNLTITVESGVRADALQRTLSEQHLAIPTLPHNGRTIGGLVASNARYWGDRGLGWRDHVLAVTWLDGSGKRLRFGRKTMKNVAGYDVVKLAVGSWGTLGVLTEFTFRVRPQPKESAIAEVSGAELSTLLAVALTIRNLPTPPRGMVLSTDTGPRLWIWLEATDVHAQQHALETVLTASDLRAEWFSAAEKVPLVDAAHHEFEQAWNTGGEWLEGGVPPGDLLNDAVRDWSAADRVWVFPFSGAIEWYRPEPVPSGERLPGWVVRSYRTGQGPRVRRQSSSWVDVEDRIRTIFDPWGRFPTWEAGGDR